MTFFMKSYQEQTYAVMRIISGYVLIWHGTMKLFGFPGEDPPASGYMFWLAGPIEFLGGLLLIIGLFTRPVAFICSGFVAAAYWMAHAPRPGSALLPITNGGDLAVFMCFTYLYISARGAGIWSVDAARGDRAAP